MKAVETGQDWKIAALTLNFHVHFLFWVIIMNIKYMKIAFDEAKKAFDEDEVPVGAVIVKNGEIIARAHNKKEQQNCALYHAEILAIKEACKTVGNWRLNNCDLYVTLSPCPMCAGAIKQSRIKNVYSGLSNLDTSNLNIVRKIFISDDVNPTVNFIDNLYSEEVNMLLKKFFENKRSTTK